MSRYTKKFLLFTLSYFLIIHYSLFPFLGMLMTVFGLPQDIVSLIDQFNYDGYFEYNRNLLLTATIFHVIPGIYYMFVYYLVQIIAGITLIYRIKKVFYLTIIILILSDILDVIINNSYNFALIKFIHLIAIFFAYKYYFNPLSSSSLDMYKKDNQ